MTAFAPITAARPSAEQRHAFDKARKLAAIHNLQKQLVWLYDEIKHTPFGASLARQEAVEFRWLTATDAATHVWCDSDDLHRLVAMMRDELGLDEEGYPEGSDEREFVAYVPPVMEDL